ncbi:MAG: hypothetical protein FJ125_06030, partial [Deltaproteobacteria bacterium]|nr:hypothetical protein [Deltaproteobacteria bacterium]
VLAPQHAWWYADGPAPHGEPLPQLLLPRATLAGYFLEGPSAQLTLDLQPQQAAEYDFTLAPVPRYWQPNSRFVFVPRRMNDPIWEMTSCDAAALCTRSGPPELGPPERPGWTVRMPYTTPLAVADWDDDGRPDVLAGPILDSPVLFLNRSEPGQDRPHFAAGLLLRLEVEHETRLLHPVPTDWDGDGDQDLIASSLSGGVLFFPNMGGDRFAPPQDLMYRDEDGELLPIGEVEPDTNTIVDIADFDGDGYPDLFLYGMRGELSVFYHAPTWESLWVEKAREILVGGLPLRDVVGRVAMPQIEDVDGDGLHDLFVGTTDGRVLLLRNEGTREAPLFSGVVELSLPASVANTGQLFPDLADLDGDGSLELLLGFTDGEILFVEEESGLAGSLDFSGEPLHGIAEPPASLATRGDRVLWEEPAMPRNTPRRHDLLVGTPDGRVEVLLGVGSEDVPRYGVRFPLLAGLGPDPAPVLADLDGDAVDDLLVGLADGTVLFGRGELGQRWPTWAALTTLQADDQPIDVGETASPHVADYDRDGRPDLLVGAADGRVHLFLAAGAAGPDEPLRLTSGGPLQAGGAVLAMSGAASAAFVDWDDDGLSDLLVADAAAGQVVLCRNEGEAGSPQLAAPRLLLEQAEAGAHLVATDVNPLDCARDLLLAAADGNLHVRFGTVPTPPAPTNLAPAGDSDGLADGEAIGTAPLLSWDAVQPPAAATHRYEVELAADSDFRAIVQQLGADDELLAAPAPARQIAEPLERGRRYFWRVRSFDELGHPGYWPYPPASFAVPIGGHNPVDAAQEDDPNAAGSWEMGGSWASLKAPDAALEQLPHGDRLGVLQEEQGQGGFVLERVFVVDRPELAPESSELVLVAGSEGDDEQIVVSAAAPDGSWRELGSFAGELASHTWPLDVDEVREGALRIRLQDAVPDDRPTVALLDYLAVVQMVCAGMAAGTPCGLCQACDGEGRCRAMPEDDAACGEIDCDALDTPCRDHQPLAGGRCAAFGSCKSADEASCTAFVDALAGRECRPPSCAGSVLQLAATCGEGEESGSCQDGGAQDCFPYSCADGACKVDCTGPEGCAAGAFCKDGR